MRKLIRRPKAAVAILLVTGVVAVPAAVWASHEYSDVPTDHWAHEPVENIKTAGITNVAPPEYGINDPVTRGQMAAFLDRGLGAATGTAGFSDARIDAGTVLVGETADTAIGAISVDVPGAGGTQLVEITAQFKHANSSNCPCRMIWGIFDDSTGFSSPWPVVTTSSAPAHESMTWGFYVPSGVNSFTVLALTLNDNGSASEVVAASQMILSARTFPFLADPPTVSSAAAYPSTGLTRDDFEALAS